MASEGPPTEGRRNARNSVDVRGTNMDGPIEGKIALQKKFKSKKEGVKMSPKVLETWINETLQDAEHLDIPGVILKPEV